jgi:adenine-specific DNA-methyltransferase
LAETHERFDFVIGNPPYVSILGLSENEKEDFRATYETAQGRFDLYLLFFERALKSLKQDGRMVFITPEKFLYVETAAPLRRLLGKFQVEEIKLVDEQVFDGLVTYPTITTLANRSPETATAIQLRDGVERQCDLGVDGTSWMPLIRGADRGPSRPKLQELCVRISCGVATGADNVFVREARGLEPQLAAFGRPTLAGRELTNPEEIGAPKYSMLLPYTEDGLLMEERDLGALGDYLSLPSVRARLLNRTCVRRKPWYSFHETPPLPEILRPKILCKDITRRPRFWIDRKGQLVPRHSVYYVVPENAAIIDSLCAYLNSPQVADWLSEHCQRAANGFLRLQSNILKAIPLPDELRPGVRRRRYHSRRARSPKLPEFVFAESAR